MEKNLSWSKSLPGELVRIALAFGLFVGVGELLRPAPEAGAMAVAGGALEAARKEEHALAVRLERDLRQSHATLRAARDELAALSTKLEGDRRHVERVIAESGERLRTSVDVALAGYLGEVDRSLADHAAMGERLARVETRMRSMVQPDPKRIAEATMYPVIQIKGNRTVGSGVVIYSEPETAVDVTATGAVPAQTGSATIAAAPPAVRYTTFALTAYHVVKEILAEEFPLGTLEEVRYLASPDAADMEITSASVELADPEHDLALLRLRTRDRFPFIAEILPRDELGRLELFTRAYAVGCPLGNRPLATAGHISLLNKVVGDQNFWMLTAPTFFGNSGGGVFDSETCRLIGVSSMIYTYTYGASRSMVVPHMGLFVPIEAVYDWLNGERYGFVLRARRTEEPAIEAIVDQARSTLARPEPSGLHDDE
jgi:S1-C subfamily serine protease